MSSSAVSLVRRHHQTWLLVAVDLARPLGLVHQVRAGYFAAIERGADARQAAEAAVLEWIVPERPELLEVGCG